MRIAKQFRSKRAKDRSTEEFYAVLASLEPTVFQGEPKICVDLRMSAVRRQRALSIFIIWAISFYDGLQLLSEADEGRQLKNEQVSAKKHHLVALRSVTLYAV